ncbi:hypothetical protein FraEuI1c_0164 [Pseudofrankia inefficax]|uniref:Uncharacterized protein n=1 Tax=Pseudofrankia inefficax (strain DSM 45817 / CECT 9037 / DDB 130130 / EuI1c) TaxID=298654 RepID=E3J4T3_PSEI1|nr:hypothetical protein FraEuI1c_0164 [Pseudofrankia inefficax]
MFGFEFQTANAFVKGPFVAGVGERQVAWRHTLTKATLEGDESRRPGATADLEFVTPAVEDLQSANAAVGALTGLAQAILDTRPVSGGIRIFKKGGQLAGGVWQADCAILIHDETFGAQAQGTVGVPLTGIGTLLSKVWARTAGHSDSHSQVAQEESGFFEYLSTAIPACQEAENVEAAELYGFLTACHLFLVRATRAPLSFVSGEDLTGFHPTESKGIFDFSDRPDVRAAAARVRGLEAPPERALVKVGSDSPKDMFQLLHRTDFHSMYLAVPEKQRKIIEGRPVAEALWPPEWSGAEAFVFPLPYRIEAEATDTRARGLEPLTKAEWINEKAPRLERAPVTWTLVDHGPTIGDWWTSVQKGDVRRDGIPKDAASPPPGFRGRDPKYLATFPDSSIEDKATFYGMGSFPIDVDKKTGIPLAVYEHRDLMADKDIPPQEKLGLAQWSTVVAVFVEHYVPTLG